MDDLEDAQKIGKSSYSKILLIIQECRKDSTVFATGSNFHVPTHKNIHSETNGQICEENFFLKKKENNRILFHISENSIHPQEHKR